MLIAVSKQSALRALRVFRSARRRLPHRRHELPEPDPSPQSRWTAGIVPLDALGLSAPPDEGSPIDVIVPTAGSCGTAKERVESKDPDMYCLDWFMCFRKEKKQ